MNAHDTEAQQYDSCEVYTFTTENGVYRYTSYESNLTIDGNVFEAVPIKRSGFNKDLQGQSITMNIQLPVSSVFAEYLVILPFIPITFLIQKFYFDDLTSGQLVFSGEVKSLTISKQVINAECVSSTQELDRKLPRFLVQSYCNNSFGDRLCGANLNGIVGLIQTTNLFTVEDIDSEDSSIIYIDNLHLLFGGNKLLNLGTVNFNNDSRLITEQNNEHDFIRLHAPILDLKKGDTIETIAACDKSYTRCKVLYQNIDNYTGMAYVPKGSNPTIHGVL